MKHYNILLPKFNIFLTETNSKIFLFLQKKEKKRFPYHFRKNAEVDTADLQLYEPVEKMAPFTRKTLVLVSPPGVGVQTLIKKLVKHDPKIFETTKAGKIQACITYCNAR